MTTTYLVLDTETTGLDPVIMPVEVAWIKIDENMNVLDEQVHRVNPLRPIHPGAIAIHGITDQDVALAPLVEVVTDLLPRPFVACGHNVGYDLRVLAPYIEYNGEICTLALSRRWIKGTSNHKLSTLKEELKLSEQASHSALGDCRTVLELLKLISTLSGRTLPQLLTLESLPKMLPVMPFGRYRGKKFNDIPRPYRDWLMSKEDLHKDLRYTLEKLHIL